MAGFLKIFLTYFSVYSFVLCLTASVKSVLGSYIVEMNQNDVYTIWVQEEKVKVDMLYESLCPGCIEDYTTDLLPTMERLGSYITLSTYPYGNAVMQDDNGQVTIKCQHGEAECYGNKLHACAIDILKDVLKYVKFNACMMPLHSTDEAADQCGKEQQVDWEAIKSCAKSDRGFQLLKHYGDLTKNFHITGTPSVFVNGQDTNLDVTMKQAVCQALKNPPKECSENMLKTEIQICRA